MNTTAMLQDDLSSTTAIGPVTFPNALPVRPLEFDRSKIVEHPQDEIEALSKKLKEFCPSFSCTANWVYYGKSGHIQLKKAQACHASVSRHDKETYAKPFATENGMRRAKTKDEKLIAPFLSWLLYVSPYGEFILNRNNFDECLNYGFIISPTIPQPLFMNICILTRHFYEACSQIFKMFNKLTMEEKYDPTIVYSVLFNTYSLFSEGLEGRENMKYRPYSGHRVSEAYSLPTLLNIFNGVYGEVRTETMGKVKTIYGSQGLFKTSKTEANLVHWANSNKHFKESLKVYRQSLKKSQKIYRPPNPFVRHTRQNEDEIYPGEFTNKEAVDFVIPWLDSQVREELTKNGK